MLWYSIQNNLIALQTDGFQCFKCNLVELTSIKRRDTVGLPPTPHTTTSCEYTRPSVACLTGVYPPSLPTGGWGWLWGGHTRLHTKQPLSPQPQEGSSTTQITLNSNVLQRGAHCSGQGGGWEGSRLEVLRENTCSPRHSKNPKAQKNSPQHTNNDILFCVIPTSLQPSF